MHHLARQVATGELLQERLGRGAADAGAGRQPGGEVHDGDVEERRAGFQPPAHAGAVGLDQQSLGQRRLEIELLDEVDDVRFIGRGRHRTALKAETIEAGGRDVGCPDPMTADAVHLRRLNEALEQKREGDLLVADRPAFNGAADGVPHDSRQGGIALGEDGTDVGRVAAEQLVGAFADHRHAHVFRRPARQQGRRNPCRIGQRLAAVADDVGQHSGEIVGPDVDADMRHVQGLGHRLRPVALVIGLFGKAQGVRRHRHRGVLLAGHRGDERGVDAAAQEYANGHVDGALTPDGIGEHRVEGADGGGLGWRLRRAPAPELAFCAPVWPERHHVGRPQAMDLAKRGLAVGEIAELKEMLERRGIDRNGAVAGGHESRDLGREADDAVRFGVEKRALAGPIAGQQQAPGARIPHGDGKHAHQTVDEGLAQLAVQAGNDGHVDGLAHRPAARGEPRPEVLVIVDLAVADHRDAGVGIDDRLHAIVDGANGQPARTETDARVTRGAAAIRAAVLQRREHGIDGRHRHRRIGSRVEIDPSADPAHQAARRRGDIIAAAGAELLSVAGRWAWCGNSVCPVDAGAWPDGHGRCGSVETMYSFGLSRMSSSVSSSFVP